MKRNSLWKKIISVLLTAAMVMTAVPVSASGFETEETDRTGFSAVSEETETDTFRQEIPETEPGEFLQSDTSDGNESDTPDGNEPDSSTDEEEPDTPVQEENALQKMIDEAEVGRRFKYPREAWTFPDLNRDCVLIGILRWIWQDRRSQRQMEIVMIKA